MEDPINGHPTRADQLDLMTTVMADAAGAVDATPVRVLDLGCGTGYTVHKLMRKRPGLHVLGVDLKGHRFWRGARIAHLSLEEVEKWLIRKAMTRCGGSANEAAKALGLSRSAFYRRLEKHRIKPPSLP